MRTPGKRWILPRYSEKLATARYTVGTGSGDDGPVFKFTEAFSLVVRCDNQEEVDYDYAKLPDGGSESQCGWIKERFGASWQIVPHGCRNDQSKGPKAMQAMLGMK